MLCLFLGGDSIQNYGFVLVCLCTLEKDIPTSDTAPDASIRRKSALVPQDFVYDVEVSDSGGERFRPFILDHPCVDQQITPDCDQPRRLLVFRRVQFVFDV